MNGQDYVGTVDRLILSWYFPQYFSEMSGSNVYFVYFYQKIKCRQHLGQNINKFVSFSLYLCRDGKYITYHTYTRHYQHSLY